MTKYLVRVATLLILAVGGLRSFASEPVWPEKLRDESNTLVEFAGEIDWVQGEVVLEFSAASIARVKVNGAFASYGPARAPSGYARWDRWDLTRFMRPGRNLITIEVAGYRMGTFYMPRLDPFLEARLSVDGCVKLETAAKDGACVFVAHRRTDRYQRVTRLNYQRGPVDAWQLPEKRSAALKLVAVERPLPLERVVPYPEFRLDTSFVPRYVETIERREENVKYVDRAIANIGKEEGYEGFLDGTYEVDLMRERQRVVVLSRRQFATGEKQHLAPGAALLYEGAINNCGFIGFRFNCTRPGRVIISFDECDGRAMDYWMNASVDFTAPGEYTFETIEPYEAKFIRLYTIGAEGEVVGAPYIREYKNPVPFQTTFKSSDPELDKIFAAARESLAQNTLDTLMDCPGRERGSYLCDSTFTGEASSYVDWRASVERAFFEDWALAKEMPLTEDKDMLPPLYPASTGGRFTIRSWPAWLIIHAANYLDRTDDKATIDALLLRLVKQTECYLAKYYDKKSGYIVWDGGIENYPTPVNRPQGTPNFVQNMVWVKTLESIAKLTGRADFAAEARRLRTAIGKDAWNGTWFQASSKAGDITECQQIYALAFDFATPLSHADLWRRVRDELGPMRIVFGNGGLGNLDIYRHRNVRFSDIFPAGAMRLQLLSRYGETAAFFRDTKRYYGYMAEMTGTLWEHCAVGGSLSHGFPTSVLPLIHAEALGIRRIDRVNKTVYLRRPDKTPLLFAEGSVPLSDKETLRVFCQRTPDGFDWRVTLPKGWTQRVSGESYTRKDIRVRDPFVLSEKGTYYLYETKSWEGERGVSVRTSKDLVNWSERSPVMELPSSNACIAVWAPEVHHYSGAYWLFTTLTFNPDSQHPIASMVQEGFEGSTLQPRGVWIFRSDSPFGPFKPVREGSVTPAEWMCLDGTLWVENGEPWMVFCHEWCQTGNGRMMAAPLSRDLTHFTSEPIELFRAADAPKGGRVTDGPFLYRTKDGVLRMLWSNSVNGPQGWAYGILECSSESGIIRGPWKNHTWLYTHDGGHSMLFRKTNGDLTISFHSPNAAGNERMKFTPIEETPSGFKLQLD